MAPLRECFRGPCTMSQVMRKGSFAGVFYRSPQRDVEANQVLQMAPTHWRAPEGPSTGL